VSFRCLRPPPGHFEAFPTLLLFPFISHTTSFQHSTNSHRQLWSCDRLPASRWPGAIASMAPMDYFNKLRSSYFGRQGSFY
jgi:hypothetical protein